MISHNEYSRDRRDTLFILKAESLRIRSRLFASEDEQAFMNKSKTFHRQGYLFHALLLLVLNNNKLK